LEAVSSGLGEPISGSAPRQWMMLDNFVVKVGIGDGRQDSQLWLGYLEWKMQQEFATGIRQLHLESP
jgi:hypothetical protein